MKTNTMVDMSIQAGMEFPVVGKRADPPDRFTGEALDFLSVLVDEMQKDDLGVKVVPSRMDHRCITKKGIIIEQGDDWIVLRNLLSHAFEEIRAERRNMVEQRKAETPDPLVYVENWPVTVQILTNDKDYTTEYPGAVKISERGGPVLASAIREHP